jgi:hypothetical protein
MGGDGCLLDATKSRVESAERPAMSEHHCGERPHRKSGPNRWKAQRVGRAARLARDSVMQLERAAVEQAWRGRN